ncbi:MAG TPA: hypothetical protein VKQ72_00385 [Aggregatilineales bacterium]|nr:hypothetical protein [Aggregatilineales bacterium]
MSTTTIIDNESVTLWYHTDKKIVHHQFHKAIYGDDFRELLNKGLEIFKKNGAGKWLSDDRKNSTLPASDTEWAQKDWFPRVFQAGWKYWAIVLPDKVFGKMNMQQFINAYAKQGLTIEVFGDPDEALKWLESF